MKRIISLQACIAAAALLFCATAFSQSSAPAQVRVALKGYDPVAYFTEGRPVKGSPAIAYDFDEARYHFSSAEHRDLFAANPDRYAPRFGGYCTGSMSRGVKNEGDPEIWIIEEGRLYVFGSGKGDEEGKAKGRAGVEKLKADPKRLAELARQNWEGMRK
ncbi:MAG TPA: YHS domain-containing (seleno)protein [Usitatibacteraceae bacterium]|nr:YHS domain-containing (seleno)protein [Usitatibacteraceae bacterium]